MYVCLFNTVLPRGLEATCGGWGGYCGKSFVEKMYLAIECPRYAREIDMSASPRHLTLSHIRHSWTFSQETNWIERRSCDHASTRSTEGALSNGSLPKCAEERRCYHVPFVEPRLSQNSHSCRNTATRCTTLQPEYFGEENVPLRIQAVRPESSTPFFDSFALNFIDYSQSVAHARHTCACLLHHRSFYFPEGIALRM